MENKPELNVTLDSGAFSAFTQKKEVNLDEYCDFIIKNRSMIGTVVNLDVINPQGPDAAAAAGMQNFLKMLERGIVSMPVFHARESIKWLDQMLGLASYIGLSGTSLVSPVEDKAWHRLIWNYVTDDNGYPIAKFHSFGNTSEYMALTMPWYSMDSATWMIQGGRAARVKLQGKSFQLRSNKIGDVNFISNDDKGPKRESWMAEIRDLGLDPEKVMTVDAKGSAMAMIRAYLVASDLMKLQEQSTDVKRFAIAPSLISTKYQREGGFVREGPVKMTFVISPSAYYFNYPILVALGVKNILVSYFYVNTAPKGFWDERIVPFITDPYGFLEHDPKVRRLRDKLNEVLLKPIEKPSEVVAV